MKTMKTTKTAKNILDLTKAQYIRKSNVKSKITGYAKPKKGSIHKSEGCTKGHK